jgi:opacity protein-like surface antigen
LIQKITPWESIINQTKEEIMFHNSTFHSIRLLYGFSATLLILGIAAISGTAQAEGWYGGIGFGQTEASEEGDTCTDASSLFDPGYSCSSDRKDKGWKLFIGRQFDFYKDLAAEVAYVDLGKFTTSASGTVGSIPSTADADVKVKGVELAFVGTWPVSDAFGVIGRVGGFRWDLKTDASATGGLAADSLHKTGFNLTYGVGVKYDFTKQLGARAEWERFKRVGDPDTTGRSDVELLSLNLVFKFK